MKRKLAGLAVLTGMAAATTLLAPASPAQASVGLYRVAATSVLDATNTKTMPISCNGVDQVVGAGGRINDGQGDVLITRVVRRRRTCTRSPCSPWRPTPRTCRGR